MITTRSRSREKKSNFASVRNYFLDTRLVFSEPRMFESLNVMSGYFNAAAHVSVVPEPAAIF